MNNEPQADTADHQDDYPECFKELCIEAMRLALEADGAPDRCTARICRRTGRCNFTMEGDQPGICHAGIPGPVAAQAALMLAFFADATAGEHGPAA